MLFFLHFTNGESPYRSGGGKSTIVSLLCGNYKPEKGEITIDGVGLSELKAKEYRKRLGIVQQETEIFNESLERNIVFGVEHYTREELLEAAEKANCLEFITKFDEGKNKGESRVEEV